MEETRPPALDAPARALAIGAHPDDLEYFAGATLANLARRGTQVSLVVCTDGARGASDVGGLAWRRRQEAEEAAAVLGLGSPIYLGFLDGSLVPDDELRGRLVHAIRRHRPELLLVHDPTTFWTRIGGLDRFGHSDHRAAGEAALDAVMPRAPLATFHPEHAAEGLKPWIVREVWLFDTAAPDHFVDVRGELDRKRRSLACHVSQNPAMLTDDVARLEDSHAGRAGFPAEGFRRLRMY